MSMIERQIEELEALKTAMQLDVDMGRVKAHRSIKNRLKIIDSALDIIKTQSEKIHAYAMERSSQYYHSGWIPCEELLPKERNKLVLCWVKSTTIAGGETYIIGSHDNGGWFLQTYDIGCTSYPVKDYKVTAWRPLPEAYRRDD